MMPLTIDEEKCTGCGKCVDVCHRFVYRLEERGERRVAVPSRAPYCLRCYLCIDPCPVGAISISDETPEEK
ncbi:MAG: 4Fe-4S dicluster domain-containing protein [Candidatus Helarchaeota archaeon]